MRDAGHRTPDAGRRTSDNGHRTAKKAKIIYPPPRGVDIINLNLSTVAEYSPSTHSCYTEHITKFSLLVLLDQITTGKRTQTVNNIYQYQAECPVLHSPCFPRLLLRTNLRIPDLSVFF